MTWTRRDFLKTTAAITGATTLAPYGDLFADEKAKKPLKLLILGGTAFLGPHTVETAIRRGHEVTLFNRGRTNTHLFPDLEKLKGDRDDQLEALEGRKWDAVIDTSGYVPRHVKLSAELLAPNVGQYVFISSVSVYKDFPAKSVDESSPVGTIDDPTVEQVTGRTYGPLKALCEQAAEKAFPGRTTNIRPGYIVGPLDPTDRFTHWPVRVARGGEVLAPGEPADPIQVIDVRDLADWMIHTIEQKIHGIFNADGRPVSMKRFLDTCKDVSKSDAKFTWVGADFLKEQKLRMWSTLPIWFDPPEGGPTVVDVEKSVKAGMKFRTLAKTVEDTLKWHQTERPADYKMRTGLSPEKEKELLAAWQAHLGKQGKL